MVAPSIAYFPRCTATAVNAAITAPGESNESEKERDREAESERAREKERERERESRNQGAMDR